MNIFFFFFVFLFGSKSNGMEGARNPENLSSDRGESAAVKREGERAGADEPKAVRLQKKKRNRQPWSIAALASAQILGSQMVRHTFIVCKVKSVAARWEKRGKSDCIISRQKKERIKREEEKNQLWPESLGFGGARWRQSAEELNCDDDDFINQKHSQHDTISYTSLNRFLFNWFPFVSIVGVAHSLTRSSSVKASFPPIFSVLRSTMPSSAFVSSWVSE